MSNKRPGSNYGNTNSAYKKQKKDGERKPPTYSNGPNFNRYPPANQNKQSTSNNRVAQAKILFQPPTSIVDKDFLIDEIEDEVLYLASQNAEQKERDRNQKLIQVSEELNASSSYRLFSSKAAGTSTQFSRTFKPYEPVSALPNGTRSGFTEQIEKNLFVDLTLLPDPVGHSQKENIPSQQALINKENKIRALEIQLRKAKQAISDLEESHVIKNGEASNLRRDKKALEDTITTMRHQIFQSDAEQIKDDPEINRLREEVGKLTDQIFQMHRTSVAKLGKQKTKSKVPFFTNFLAQATSVKLKVSPKTFMSDAFSGQVDSSKLALCEEAAMNVDVVETQLNLAQVCAKLLAGGHIDKTAVDELFEKATLTIRNISDYIKYLECKKDEDIVFHSDLASTVYFFISIPCLREKLTSFDPLLNSLNKDDGFLTVFQAEKFYPEEMCSKPRRIIACYSTIARFSRLFSEKLLQTDVIDDGRTNWNFVSVLNDSLMFKVTQSENVFDYFGFAIASANLLSSLGSHYSNYLSNHRIIHERLANLFRALLECQCDSPLMMDPLSDFLLHVTKDPEKTELAQRICTNYSRKIISSENYKFFEYPPEACSFQLFLMHLLTAFKFKSEPNQFELELLMRTTLNLNKIASNILEMKVGSVGFLQTKKRDAPSDLCGCFSTLIYAVLTLNHLALANRNFHVNHTTHLDRYQSQGSSDQEDRTNPNFNKHHNVMKEIVKGCITSLSDLFMHIDPIRDFPFENLMFCGQLEQICNWIKYGVCFDNENNMLSCWEAYGCEALDELFQIINVHPRYLTTHTDRDDDIPMNDVRGQHENCEKFRVALNAELEDEAM